MTDDWEVARTRGEPVSPGGVALVSSKEGSHAIRPKVVGRGRLVGTAGAGPGGAVVTPEGGRRGVGMSAARAGRVVFVPVVKLSPVGFGGRGAQVACR